MLDREIADDGLTLLPSDDTGFSIQFQPTQEQKAGLNQMHFDLTSKSLEDQQQTVARSLELGARHIHIGQRPEEGAIKPEITLRQLFAVEALTSALIAAITLSIGGVVRDHRIDLGQPQVRSVREPAHCRQRAVLTGQSPVL